jgi:radical SAM protein with 4Fe4S-binding SPASM domain
MIPVLSKIVVKPFEWLYKDFPPTVRVETTNLCNARCVTCPREEMTRELGIMDMDLYEKIIHECAENRIGCIHLHNFGEPLMDKHLSVRIKMAKEVGIPRVKIFSNGSLLTSEKALELIESGLDEIKISIDGYTKETFEKIRKRLSYDVVVDNISTFVRLRERSHRNTPKVILNFVRTDNNIQEEKAFVNKWTGEVDKISIDKAHNWGVNDFIPLKNSRLHKPCLRVWNTFTILWNGDVALCCLDYNGQVILGNVEQGGIAHIWHGERLKEIRECHVNADLEGIPICRNCSKARL